MNTFLPYLNFSSSAKALDKRRLFKQLIEARQIIDILETGKTKDGKDYPNSMKHHPIVLAWADSVNCLKFYYNSLLDECKAKEIKVDKFAYYGDVKPFELPSWLTEEVCRMYQAHLMRKDCQFYSFDVDPSIPFNWKLIYKYYQN